MISWPGFDLTPQERLDRALAQHSAGPTPGAPILHGPFVIDFSDIPHDGDTLTLWTPAVGDVLLSLFVDIATVVQWDQGTLFVGQDVSGTDPTHYTYFTMAPAGHIGLDGYGRLDLIGEGINGGQKDLAGVSYGVTGVVLHTDHPVAMQLAQTGGTDPTTGHVELYALIARAVAP